MDNINVNDGIAKNWKLDRGESLDYQLSVQLCENGMLQRDSGLLL